MFKGEYQGGACVEVFSAQGRDPISKRCRVIGGSSNIHKQYDKDVKSYVCVLEGEPTTTQMQLPKDEKQTLFLLQRFLVLQIFLPLGRSFSFELGVTDIAQNKRRIFFSSSQKDVTVTPLHAKFPLTLLCLGTWLNLCVDLGSVVGETFNGQTFRALESITVTANCRLRKIFTLKVPPADTSGVDVGIASYTNWEPLPKGLQMITSPDVHPITQILSYSNLSQKSQGEPPDSAPSTVAANDASTLRQQNSQQTHIAFGSKVVIPPHVRRSSFKENHENTVGKVARTARSSHSQGKVGHSAPDLRDIGEATAKAMDKLVLKGTQGLPTKSDTNENLSESVNSNQARMQPRPPRTSSAGKVRRPVRVKPTSAAKVGTARIKMAGSDEKQHEDSDINKPAGNSNVGNIRKSSAKHNGDTLKNEGISEMAILHAGQRDISSSSSDKERILNSYNDHMRRTSHERTNGSDDIPTTSESFGEMAILDPEQRAILRSSSGKERILNSYNDHIQRTTDERTNRSDDLPTTSESFGIENSAAVFEQRERDEVSRTSITNNQSVSERRSSSVANGVIQKLPMSSANSESDPTVPLVAVQVSEQLDNKILKKQNQYVDVNNNEESSDDHVNSNSDVSKPRLLSLTGENSVFTFASRPRSPRSGKKKILGSPVAVERSVSPVEHVPEVKVNLEEDDGIDCGKNAVRNRGASLEDDFCKLSDDELRADEDGIKRLLNSSLSPRHTPSMPFHHHLRQSIRSSMLKEIPSPVNENGYDAQNYQSEPQPATLSQSAASSWRFDLSNSSNSFNQTHEDLEDSLDANHDKLARSGDSSGMLGNDMDDDVLSDGSDDTTYSTWRAPPQDLRGNKYQNEMKPPGNEPDLSATISMDARDYCDVFSPPIILTSSKPDKSVGVSPVSPMRPSKSPHILSPGTGRGTKQLNEEVEEELDLLYDPFLNCYFDPKTHKYYELA